MFRDFPGSPVNKNPPCNAGFTGLIPGLGTKIPRDNQAHELLITEFVHPRAHAQQDKLPQWEALALQLKSRLFMQQQRPSAIKKRVAIFTFRHAAVSCLNQP